MPNEIPRYRQKVVKHKVVSHSILFGWYCKLNEKSMCFICHLRPATHVCNHMCMGVCSVFGTFGGYVHRKQHGWMPVSVVPGFEFRPCQRKTTCVLSIWNHLCTIYIKPICVYTMYIYKMSCRCAMNVRNEWMDACFVPMNDYAHLKEWSKIQNTHPRTTAFSPSSRPGALFGHGENIFQQLMFILQTNIRWKPGMQPYNCQCHLYWLHCWVSG